MQTTNSLEKRLENLENAKEEKEEKRTIICVDHANTDPKDNASYIIDKCEAACEDKKTYYKALGDALATTGKNPLESEDAISFIVITKDIAVKTVENLKAAGIEVEL